MSASIKIDETVYVRDQHLFSEEQLLLIGEIFENLFNGVLESLTTLNIPDVHNYKLNSLEMQQYKLGESASTFKFNGHFNKFTPDQKTTLDDTRPESTLA